MREIKFRLYDELKGMVDVDLLPLQQPNGKEKRPLMQYTGLKDKNGKEIAEGDILSQKIENGDEWGRGHVVWHEPIAAFVVWDRNKDTIKWKFPISQWRGTFEIIGNIYENPELI